MTKIHVGEMIALATYKTNEYSCRTTVQNFDSSFSTVFGEVSVHSHHKEILLLTLALSR